MCKSQLARVQATMFVAMVPQPRENYNNGSGGGHSCVGCAPCARGATQCLVGEHARNKHGHIAPQSF